MTLFLRTFLVAGALTMVAPSLSAQNPRPPEGPPTEVPTGLPPMPPGGPGGGQPPRGPGGAQPPRGAVAGQPGPAEAVGACFAAEPSAGVRDRKAHLAFAKGKKGGALADNLGHKLDLLSACPAVTHEALSSTFGDISVVIPKYVRDAKCFDGDTGVLNRSRAAHERFAREQSHTELLENLKWKTAAAMKCIPPSKQAAYFADVSVEIAGAQQ